MTRTNHTLRTIMYRTSNAMRHLLPSISAISGDVVGSSGVIEAAHWTQLEFLSGALCDACGAPLSIAPLAGALCGACEIRRPTVRHCRSALAYCEISKQLILGFKHAGRADSVEVFAQWMCQAAPDILEPPGILLPVPLHLFRRMHRKFNQSALLGRAIAAKTGLAHQPLWLRRTRHTPPQGFKSGLKRAKNVRGAFAVSKRAQAHIKGQRIILIDDVRTSGATLDACAKVLLGAGAAKVDAITLARIVKAAKPIT